MVQLTWADVVLSSVGGILISLSTTFHLYTKGRVTGFSGIFYSIISWDRASLNWKAALVCGLVSTAAVLYNIFNFGTVWDNTQIFDAPGVMVGNLDIVGFGIAGLLVGVGTKLSNGCTSGHGVCGLPRFAPRSWVSVGVFLSVAIGIATLKYHVPFLDATQGDYIVESFNYDVCANIFLGLSLLLLIVLVLIEKEDKMNVVIGFITGVIFAVGLGFGGMFRRSKIIGFLALRTDWDPSLMFLLGGAVGCNMLSFNYMTIKIQKPFYAPVLQLPARGVVDLRLVLGSTLFGLGWGIGGLCPGPAMSLLPIFSIEVCVVWYFCLAAGQIAVAKYDTYTARVQPNQNSNSNNNNNRNAKLTIEVPVNAQESEDIVSPESQGTKV